MNKYTDSANKRQQEFESILYQIRDVTKLTVSEIVEIYHSRRFTLKELYQYACDGKDIRSIR